MTDPAETVAPGAAAPWTSADPLGEALHDLRMSGVLYTRSELTAPWSIELPAMRDCVLFHVVTRGDCWIEVEGEAPSQQRSGEFSLLPRGEGHRIASAPGAPATPLLDLPVEKVSPRYEIIRHGGGGEPTHLVCGAVRFDHPAARDLVELLPRRILASAWSSPQAEWMQATLRLMAAEATTLRPGGETIVTRLADILVIQTIRSWLAENPDAQTGWLGALEDDRIGPAILSIHRDPARAWTVASLAREVALSRSAFAARFRELVGESPMQYLARWRMHVASTWLRESDAPLADFARRLGYRSEAAFSRAFKRVIGVSPGSMRRQGEANDLVASRS